MLKTLFFLYLVAIALLSVIILITFKFLNDLILFTVLSINIISLMLMILNIQSIGSNIYTYAIFIFIFINNIFMSLVRFILNLSLNNKTKEGLVKFLSIYIKVFYIYPNYILRKLFSLTSKMLNIFNNRVNNLLYDLLVIEPLNLINKEYDKENKNTLLTFENNRLLDHKNLFAALFAALILQPEFLKVGKKIMIVSISKEDKTFFIHKNIIIDENTTINNYLDKIKNSIQVFYESGYPISSFNILQVKLWDFESSISVKGTKTKKNSIHKFRRSFYTSCLLNKNTNLINPLKTPKNLNKIPIATIDLETIELNNNQIPISISFSYILNNELFTIFELIDSDLLLINPNKAVKLLWLNFMSKLNDLKLEKCVIFSHNLGSFDGYFIFKGLLELPEIDINKVNSIIDDLHRFISIEIIWKDSKFIFKDSLRVFPVSLQELCSLFKVEGKLHHYNPLFNKISLFKNKILLNQFIEYARQDSISLLTALIKAQDIYINEHKVDIATIWSTSTLSLKIFRQKFLNINIPTLNSKLDNIIRLGYMGGSTDYFYKYGENLKHYDVNSLYPKAMCNPMPMEFLGEIDGTKLELQDIFGFAEARITTPNNLDVPLLPLKIENETIHPLGSWIGIYFTEELKTVNKYGYKVELIKVYNFTKADIFTNYINYFYEIKKFATGPLRLIAKMHLNTLYGYFGRRKTLIETKNVYKNDLMKYYSSNTIFSEININENISTILMSSNLDYDLINEIKESTDLHLTTSFRNIKSNVAIAAAVTAYARIHMSQFKNNPDFNLYYTDTDSGYFNKPLPEHMVNSKILGKMKLENIIDKGIFLAPKMYYLKNKDGKVIYKVKGLSHDIELTRNDFENLLFKQSTLQKTSN
jgi:DNA polymerase type B, organellar and viral